nr:cyclic GMP-AMP synthase-like receptor isoform X1 [Helicoverpa armigera]XP_049698472.1 cyclic GMP-AMP synthase-like receptor isoform X1 [Helicoverpa armigera]
MTNSESSRRGQRRNHRVKMEKIFQQVTRRHVRIKRRERRDNNSVLNKVLQEFLNIMRKCDSLFSSMNPKLEYLGSYFDGMRVGQPTEYDINVILTFHVNYSKIELDARDNQNGYTSIIMPEEFRRLSKTPATAIKGFKKTEIWCDRSHRLLVTGFRSWMQSVVDAALDTLPQEDGKRILKVQNKYFKILYKMSGPANTIKIYVEDDYVIDVDLVPTLAFELPKKPFNSKIDFNKVKQTKKAHYFAVPKPSDTNFSWRLAFPYQERYYTDNTNKLKGALKLLKLFRDVQGFNKLASYFIKTLFLWEVVENDDKFWSKNSLTFLVIHMLKKLRDALALGIIKNFWCSDHNLLEKIKKETCQNWSNRISNIVDDIERNVADPYIVLKYFVASYELNRSSSEPVSQTMLGSASSAYELNRY